MDNIKIKKAELLAKFIHCDQKRRDGEDYIYHPDRMVGEYIRSISGNECYRIFGECQDDLPILTDMQENITCAIWLHDTIEDGKNPELIGRIILEWFGEEVHTIVCTLTHDKNNESYIEYITRVFQHRSDSWQIKWLDMIDNTGYSIPEKQKTKYRDACIHLMAHGVTVPDILKERLEI